MPNLNVQMFKNVPISCVLWEAFILAGCKCKTRLRVKK